eukprot:CAMPEP_0174920406 /NCGR_PEP_ID=MMETSP1355-20121228/4367_1 /TAXON_ID=464990 /ORGANISM="Hemiselmis tepida, Strain CCMP443" /LENGTH=351 /DNA_ID=CAMNT_0016165747 /DNA_START=616 /DNA_END=1671 /DNA_ORIENTATION=+
MTMCAMIKEQNKHASARSEALEIDTKAPPAAKAKAEESEEAIFSACHSPEDDHNLDDGAAVTDLEGFELNYLHQLYTVPDGSDMFAHSLTDAILPDATAPPSLGYSAQVAAALKTESAPASSTHSALSEDADEEPASAHSSAAGNDGDDEVSAPSTPPRASSAKGADSQWATAAREASPPAPRGNQKSGSGRKRRASTLHGSPQPAPPVKQSRTSAAAQKREEREREKEAAAAAAAAAAHASDDDDSDDDSASGNHPTLDGLEIRPEDDPLGLFSRDPATLTSEEQRLLKKQRRLLKNRESAQLSRHRKKMHLNALEKQVEALKRDKAALAQKVQALHDDNERLRKQLISA